MAMTEQLELDFVDNNEESKEQDFTLSIAAKERIDQMELPSRNYSACSFESRAVSVIVTKADFQNLPIISKCLPEYKPIALEKSEILSTAQIKVLSYHLPAIVRLFNWKLVFSTYRDGNSHHNFFDKCSDHEYTILVIKDRVGFIFGALCAEAWDAGEKGFYGNGDNFVFTFRNSDDLEIFPATGMDTQYQSADADGIIIGGSTVIKSRAAITVNNRFRQGHSGNSSTFENDILCGELKESSESLSLSAKLFQNNGDYQVDLLEVWGFDMAY